MKKSWKILLAILLCVTVLAVAATAGLSVMTFMKVSAIETRQAEEDAERGAEGEDDIEIGGYWIRSTKAISDAYLAGDSSALSEKDKETLDMASSVLDEVITDSMTDYDKEKAIFLWMHEHIGGDPQVTLLVRDDISTDNPHGVLSGHSAVCVGYATTFRLFMQMLDIPCMVVHDISLVHSWDLVQIDGHWYHVDLYSAQNEKEPLTYLNRNDSIQRALGSEWDDSLYPAADSLEKVYIYMNAKKADDVFAIPALVKDGIGNKAPYLSLLLPAGEETLTLAENMLSTLETTLMSSIEYGNYGVSHAITPVDADTLLVYVSILDYSEVDDDEPIISDESQEKIEKAIADAFGDLTDNGYYSDSYADNIYAE